MLVTVSFSKVFSRPLPVVNNTFFDSLERKPVYMEGEDQLIKVFLRNLRYPGVSQDSKTEGTFILTFIIDENGKVTTSEVMDNIPVSAVVLNEVIIVGYGAKEGNTHPSNKEAGNLAIKNELNRVARKIADFSPALKNGKPVEAQIAIPVRFKIELQNK